MMRRFAIPAMLAMLLATGSASAQMTLSVTLPCVSRGDAEALITSVLPDLIDDVGHICETALPPGALLRQTSGAFIAKYRAEADIAWPRAQAGLHRLVGDSADLLSGSLGRPLLGTLLAPIVTRNVLPSDCGSLERIANLIQPLPAANAAPLFVQVLQLTDAKRRDRTSKPVLTICPTDGSTVSAR